MGSILRLLCFALIAVVVADAPALLAQRQGGPNTGRQGGPETDGRGRPGGPAGRGEVGRGRGQPLRIGTASIRGRVLSATSSTPVRRATVQASYAAEQGGRGEPPRTAMTDENGTFELRDLPAGRWTIRASKMGFIEQQFGQKSAFAATDPIVLAEGQRFVADFKLSRGGAISGRITDEFGDPIAGTSVSALRLQRTQQGEGMTRTGTSVASDDNGVYRVYGLPPGQYYVSVTDPAAARIANALGAEQAIVTQLEFESVLANQAEAIARVRTSTSVSYAPTYYPGTANVADAQRITLRLGEEESGINLAIVPIRAARITGRVMNASGQPIQATIALTSAVGQGFSPNGGRNGTSSDGTFTLTNIPPGTYTLNVLGPNIGANPPEVAALSLNVTGEDILGLSIMTGTGASISGTVIAENGGRLPQTRIRVTAVPAQSSMAAFTPRAEVGQTGGFELEGLLGVYTLRFEAIPAGWMVKSITANGLDVSDSALEFRPGDRVSVRAELTNRITEVSGTVRSDRDMRGATVLIFPDEPSRWTYNSRFIRTARPSDDGQFSVTGLPPHSRYLAVAIDYLEPAEPQAAEFLQQAKGAATASFGLSAGEHTVLDLPLVKR